jgi:hypothetical protein
MTQENKDALYREEFKSVYDNGDNIDPRIFCNIKGKYTIGDVEKCWQFYLAGGKASQEEVDKWKKCSSDNEQFWQFRRTEMLQEIESLKKELEELRKANYEVESGNHDTALVDIKKLRSLVEQARLMILEMNTAIGFYVTNEDGSQEPLSKKWLKEAQELLGGGL